MSFRLEDKIKLHISDKVKLKNLIHDQKGSKLYPNRIISSVYFDNKYLDMYKDSEEEPYQEKNKDKKLPARHKQSKKFRNKNYKCGR